MFIAGLGGSAAVSIGAGVIGDLFSTKDRALAMSIYTLGPLIGPSVGPIAGGFITQTIGFKWNFIVIAIFAGCSQALGMFCLEESYAPVPEDGLRGQDGLTVQFTRFRTCVKTHPSFRDTLRIGSNTSL